MFESFKVTPEKIGQAMKMGKVIGKLRNSIRKGSGNWIGCLGEIIVSDRIGGKIVGTYNHDILKGDKKIEVKSKERSVSLKPHYEVSIAVPSKHQHPDYYVFVSVQTAKGKAKQVEIAGWMERDEYFKKARFLKRGDVDPSNNWKVLLDCYNLRIDELRPMSDFPAGA